MGWCQVQGTSNPFQASPLLLLRVRNTFYFLPWYMLTPIQVGPVDFNFIFQKLIVFNWFGSVRFGRRLTFTPFEDPVCTEDGSVFDVMWVLFLYLIFVSKLLFWNGVYNFWLIVWFSYCLIRNIIPYIRKYGKHPVTGAPLKPENLIPLTFHKNAEGNFNEFDPVYLCWWCSLVTLIGLWANA